MAFQELALSTPLFSISREHSDEPSGSIKCVKFPDWRLKRGSAPKTPQNYLWTFNKTQGKDNFTEHVRDDELSTTDQNLQQMKSTASNELMWETWAAGLQSLYTCQLLLRMVYSKCNNTRWRHHLPHAVTEIMKCFKTPTLLLDAFRNKWQSASSWPFLCTIRMEWPHSIFSYPVLYVQ
jgi:hypothetical protein